MHNCFIQSCILGNVRRLDFLTPDCLVQELFVLFYSLFVDCSKVYFHNSTELSNINFQNWTLSLKEILIIILIFIQERLGFYMNV